MFTGRLLLDGQQEGGGDTFTGKLLLSGQEEGGHVHRMDAPVWPGVRGVHVHREAAHVRRGGRGGGSQGGCSCMSRRKGVHVHREAAPGWPGGRGWDMFTWRLELRGTDLKAFTAS